MRRRSPRPAMSARTSRTSSSSCCNPPTTTWSAPSAASSISTRSTRSAASPTTPRSPATSRARVCNRPCSRSWKAPSHRCRRRADASIRSRNSSRSNHQHPVRVRRRLQWAREDHFRPRAVGLDRLQRQGLGAGGPQGRRNLPRGRAGRPVEIRLDPGIRRLTARGGHARGSRRAFPQAHSHPAQECAGETVPAAVRDGVDRSHAGGGGAGRYCPQGHRPQDRRARPALDYGRYPARHHVRSAEPRRRRGSRDLERGRRGYRAAALHLRRPRRPDRRRERIVRRALPCASCKTLLQFHKANVSYQGLSYGPKPPGVRLRSCGDVRYATALPPSVLQTIFAAQIQEAIDMPFPWTVTGGVGPERERASVQLLTRKTEASLSGLTAFFDLAWTMVRFARRA